MRVQRTKSVADKVNLSAKSKFPEITVPKLRTYNYEIFTTAFYSFLGRIIGVNGIPVDCVMCGVTKDYDYPWTNREDKLKNFLLHTGDSFKNNNITLYLLYSQYIGTKGVGSNIINKYHSTNIGSK